MKDLVELLSSRADDFSRTGARDPAEIRTGAGEPGPSSTATAGALPAPPLPDDAVLLSAEDLVQAAGVSLRTVRGWIAEGNLETVRLGRCKRVRLSEWRRFLEARTGRP